MQSVLVICVPVSEYLTLMHPQGDVHGVTLGTAVFQSPEKTMTLYHGNPCLGFRRDYDI